MKKIFLSVLGLYLSILAAFSQGYTNDSTYKKRKLTYDEANIITSYYTQDGDHASVTGGIGSQRLTNISLVVDSRFSKYDSKGRKHILTGEVGIDHYTSASSDKINPETISSASHEDLRFYPSLKLETLNEMKGNAKGAGLSFSVEADYTSYGGEIHYSKKTKNRNGEITTKVEVYLDQLKLIYPIELRYTLTGSTNSVPYPIANRNSFSGSLSWSHVINKQFQVLLDAEVIYQKGYLAMPFYRVYFKDHTDHIEKLPSSRLKIPLGLRANYFIADKFIIRTWYRYYRDDWGIRSHALQLETVAKFTPFFSITPFWRFYMQHAADYFKPFEQHTDDDAFYASNYDLSEFHSNFFGVGFRAAPPKGVLNIKRISSVELRYGHYQKSVNMNADIISMHLKFR